MRRVFMESGEAMKTKIATDEVEIDPRDFLNQVFTQSKNLTEFDAFKDDFGEFLKPLKNIMYGSFFDLMSDSTVDFIFVTKEDGVLRTISVYNNFERDNFFIKSRMISDEKIGTTLGAASVRCVLTNLNDNKFIVQGSMANNGGFHSLPLPYMHTGVGRSNNFIEQYTISVYSNGKRVQR